MGNFKRKLYRTGIVFGAFVTSITACAVHEGNNRDITSTPTAVLEIPDVPTKEVTVAPTGVPTPTDVPTPTGVPTSTVTATPTPTLDPMINIRKEIVDKIDSIVSEFVLGDYDEEGMKTINDIVSATKEALEKASDSVGAITVFDDFLNKVDLVETKLEKEARIVLEQLDSYKEEVVNKISSRIDDVKDIFKKEELTELESLFNEFKSSIFDCNLIDDVKKLYEEFDTSLSNYIKSAELRIELTTAKNTMLSKLEKVFNGYDESKYSTNNYSKINDYYNSGVNSIKKASSITDIDDIYSKTVNNMKSIKTNATILKEGKETAVSNLDKQYKKYNSKDYSKENYALIKEYYNGCLTEIENCNRISLLDGIVDDCVSNMSKVVTLLSETKTTIISDLKTFYSKIDKSLYSSDAVNLLESYYSDYVNKIKGATTVNAVNSLLGDAKSSLNEVETLVEEANSEYISESTIKAKIESVYKKYKEYYTKEDVAIFVVGANLDYLKKTTVYSVLDIDNDDEYCEVADRLYDLITEKVMACRDVIFSYSDSRLAYKNTMKFNDLFIKKELAEQAEALEKVNANIIYYIDKPENKLAAAQIYSYYSGEYPSIIEDRLRELPYKKDQLSLGPGANYFLEDFPYYLTGNFGSAAMLNYYIDKTISRILCSSSEETLRISPYYEMDYAKTKVKTN